MSATKFYTQNASIRNVQKINCERVKRNLKSVFFSTVAICINKILCFSMKSLCHVYDANSSSSSDVCAPCNSIVISMFKTKLTRLTDGTFIIHHLLYERCK